MNITWMLKAFDDLSPAELYAILRLRSEVFVVEQTCIFLDMDNKDQYCLHLLGWDGGHLAAVARIVPTGKSYAEASIGRVVTAPFARGTGLGRKLMEVAIHELYKQYGQVPIRIGAQQHLHKFYGSLGFIIASDPYDEDGIIHVEMVKAMDNV
jgi:ElaA protein